MIVTNYAGDPYDGEAIAPGDTATGLTQAKINPVGGLPAKAAFISCEDQTVNWAMEGIPATNFAGTDIRHQILAGETILLIGINSLKNFSCVDRVSGATGTLKVTYYH